MPGDLKEKNEALKTQERNSELVTIFTKPEGTTFPRSSSSTEQEQLCVEDLDVTPGQYNTPVHRLNRPSRLSLQRPYCSNSLEDAISSGNFTVYQGGDLNAFFGCDVFAPTRVSEVCLVNDHYILVKIPEPPGRGKNKVQPEMAHKTFKNTKPTTEPDVVEMQPGNKFVRYLQCGNVRSHKVSAIPTAPKRIDGGTTEKKPWSTDGCLQEVFKSRTIITRNLDGFQPTNSASMENQDSNQTNDIKSFPEYAENSSQEASKDESSKDESSKDESSKKTIFCMPLQTSSDSQVELEMHGRLKTSRNDFSKPRTSTRNQMLPRPRRPFGLSLSWFLKSFRLRLSPKKPVKAKKKVNAVVYKTYFVTWAKPEDYSPCPKCCGFKRSLRRTRSAVF